MSDAIPKVHPPRVGGEKPVEAKPVELELLDMDTIRVDPAWAMKVPPALALRRQVLPFASVGGRVYVACIDPADRSTLEAVERSVRQPICARAAEPHSLRRALDRVFGAGATAGAQSGMRVRVDPAAETDGEGAVGACDELLHAAIVRQASDIHIDPSEKETLVRLRVDGLLEKSRTLPNSVYSGVVSRFKVLGGMDIAEKRAPQDGRFTHTFGPTGQKIDVRLATLPTKYGERMTVRLLALQTESLTLERLGMRAGDLATFAQAIGRPHGLILLTGPTGSGKSTTLYAALRRIIAKSPQNVITIEDPIEYEIAGVAQVEVDAADKVSFNKALRSVLRHDPDVLMIGEIRDGETADVAMKASLTGHLVFSTLHTNSAASALTRLADMGLDRFLIAATLRLAVAQRLVRRLCAHCRRPRPLAEAEALALGFPEAAGAMVYDAGGCMYCADRGYVGRLGLFELLPFDEAMARLVAEGAGEGEIVREARRRSVPRLVDDALEKLTAGVTTVKEVLEAVTIW
jgi:general secretion pathway protein E